MTRSGSSVLTTITLLALMVAAAATQEQKPVPFRAGVVLVPVDVRVLDSRGLPLANLTAADFTIAEDGVPQRIAHFATRSVDAPAADVGVGSEFGLEAVPAARTFVIGLGRGSLNAPAKALDSLIDFLRTKLLPQDRLGVVTYLRASKLTTDHAAVIRFLERYREQHGRIENAIRSDVLGRRRELSSKARLAIDDLFQTRGALQFDRLPGADISSQRYSDVNYAITAIAYLRHIPGEKHFIFVSQEPLRRWLKSPDPKREYLVQRATGARVTLHLIHTGGIRTPAQTIQFHWRGERPEMRVLVPHVENEVFEASDLRLLAEHTGGTSVYYQQADTLLAGLDRMTRFSYLLAYYPEAVDEADHHRVIDVAVNRRGLRLLFRHGYQQRPVDGDFETFKTGYARDRIGRIATWLKEDYGTRPGGFPRSPIRLDATLQSLENSATRLRVDISFDASRFTFSVADQRYVAAIDIAVFIDIRGRPTTQRHEQITLSLTEAEYQRSKRQWVQYTVDTEVEGHCEMVRTVMFQYDSDRALYTRSNIRR